MKKTTSPVPPAIDFPTSLLPIVDKVVAHAVKGTALPKNLSKLVEWFEDEGWDDLCSAWAEEFVALKLFEMAWLNFSDQELLANLDEPFSVTDEVRLTYARELVSRAWRCPELSCRFESVDMIIMRPFWLVGLRDVGLLSRFSGRHSRVIS